MPDQDGFLTADEIEKFDDRKFEVVEAWGGKVRLKTLEGCELGKVQVLYQQRKGAVPDFKERVLAACICNGKGERLFTDAQVKILARKSSAELNRLFDIAARLNGLTEEEQREIEGN